MSDLILEAPAAVTAVPIDKAAGLVPIDDAARGEIAARADRYIQQLLAVDVNAPEFSTKAAQVMVIGQKEVVALTHQSNRLLDRPTRAIDGEGSVGQALAQLRATVERLDPSRDGPLLQPRKLFGIFPMGDRLKDYFDGYASAQGHLNAILASLARGKDELLADNIAIDGERRRLWEQMGKLEAAIQTARLLDERLEERADAIALFKPDKAKAIRETALFHVRQRHQDLLTHMAVTVQGYMAMDLVKRNNLELIKGVDRASTTTIAALRTAVTVAQALANQRLVLEQITALNATAATAVERTGDLLARGSAEAHDQAASATAQVETLQRAFANIYATMDSVDAFKRQALTNMKTTVDALAVETERAKRHIAHADGMVPGG